MLHTMLLVLDEELSDGYALLTLENNYVKIKDLEITPVFDGANESIKLIHFTMDINEEMKSKYAWLYSQYEEMDGPTLKKYFDTKLYD